MNTLIAASKRRRMGAMLFHLAMAFVLAVGIVIPAGALTNPEKAYGAVDDLLHVYSTEGVLVTYKVLTESGNNTGTVQVGEGTTGSTAVPTNTAVTVTIPPTVANPNNPGVTYTITKIGDGAFEQCTSLAGIAIPDGVTSIGEGAFRYCESLAAITIPDGVTSFGYATFWGCSSLANITIPDSVTSIGELTFLNCTSLVAVTIPDGVTSIGKGVFSFCASLAAITIPDSVTSIGDSAFQYCISLPNITLPNSLTAIELFAFYNCDSLSNLTIPASVTSIGRNFINASGIQMLTFESATPPDVTSDTFNKHNLSTIEVPAGKVATYENVWRGNGVPQNILDLVVEAGPVVTGLTVSPIAKAMVVDEEFDLTANVTPTDAADPSVTWSSGNTSVATVDANGHVVAKDIGTATITATTTSGGHTASCAVTVYKPVTQIEMFPASKTINVGDDYVLTAEITPQDADPRITWTSSDPSVAAVSGAGRIYGVSAGDATITASSVSDPSKSVTCAVKVTDGTSTGNSTTVASVQLSRTERTMILRDDYVLLADVLPEQADQRVTWTSDDPNIAYVDQRGHIWATGIGNAVIKAESVADPAKFATCDVEVIDDAAGMNEPVTGITVSPSACTLSALGPTYALTADVSPIDAANKTVIWSSDNHAVASVSQNGEVYPVSAGAANITATTVDGGFTDICKVTVTDNPGGGTVSPGGIILSSTSKTLKEGEDYTLLAEVTPMGADQRVTWASSDTGIVIVSSGGEIYAKKAGDATVTATSVDDPSVSAACAVKVIDPSTAISPTAITLSRSSKTMYEGDDYLLEAAVTPADADKKINWTSDDETVAKVDQTGNITALAKGLATIRATSATDPDVFAECILKVLAPDVEPAQVSPASLTATPEGQSVKLKWSIPGRGSSGGANAGIIYYAVYYAEGDFVSNTDYGTTPWSALTPAIVKTTDTTVPNLGKGKTYTFMVVAENSFGRATRGATVKAAIKDDNKDDKKKNVPDTVTVTSPADKYMYKAADKAHTLQLKAVSSKGNPIKSWSVDKPNIATISSTGLLSFKGAEGDVNVTAKTAEATSKAKKITAVKNVTAIATPQKTLYIQRGKSFSVPAVIYDGNAKITPALTWASSNAKIAKVSAKGKITIPKKLKKGKATITAKTANGKVLSVKVNVSKKAVKLKKATVKAPKSLKRGKTKFLTAKFSPKKATGVKITFKSNKAKGLEVDKAGKLTAKKKGKYKITIKCGNKKIVKKISVK